MWSGIRESANPGRARIGTERANSSGRIASGNRSGPAFQPGPVRKKGLLPPPQAAERAVELSDSGRRLEITPAKIPAKVKARGFGNSTAGTSRLWSGMRASSRRASARQSAATAASFSSDGRMTGRMTRVMAERIAHLKNSEDWPRTAGQETAPEPGNDSFLKGVFSHSRLTPRIEPLKLCSCRSGPSSTPTSS